MKRYAHRAESTLLGTRRWIAAIGLFVVLAMFGVDVTLMWYAISAVGLLIFAGMFFLAVTIGAVGQWSGVLPAMPSTNQKLATTTKPSRIFRSFVRLPCPPRAGYQHIAPISSVSEAAKVAEVGGLDGGGDRHGVTLTGAAAPCRW